MAPISRREFIKTASSSAALGAILSTGGRVLHADPLGLPIGCQTWPVRAMIAKDFPGTLKDACRSRIPDDRAVLAGGICRLRIRRPRQIQGIRTAKHPAAGRADLRQQSLLHG